MSLGSTEADPGRDVLAPSGARRVSDRAFARVEDVAWAALERIGIDLQPGDEDFAAALVPFVIDQESLHTIRPLQSVPVDFDVDVASGFAASRLDIRYRNRPLRPVPVLAASLAPLLLDLPALEVEFVDGHNVYGANRFERHEGRRLLRRAIGYVHEQLAGDGDRFDIIASEGDGFLIVRPMEAGRAPLEHRLREIIAAMNGEVGDRRARRAIGDRLGTFYKHASGTVLAPALVAHEKRDESATRFGVSETTRPGTAGERLSRLQSRFPSLRPLLDAVRIRSLHEQQVLLGLIEFRMFDPILEPLADRLSRCGGAIRAFTQPGEMLAQMKNRSAIVYRVELLSLLKSLNEHPLGGFRAGNEALKTVYACLVSAIQRTLANASAGSDFELYTFRRWGEFYFAVDSTAAGAVDIAAKVANAFARARYLALDCCQSQHTTVYTATVSAACPPTANTRIIIPLIPAITADAPISDDVLAMPIEEPASMRQAIASRLHATDAPEVDAVFLADWTLNACDVKRGIPRLVETMGATWAEVAELSQYYRSSIDRKGRVRHHLRRDAQAIAGFTSTLRALCA